ncbi:CHAD domain-containing protein [Peredibacter sp. HCB2-198]|uniref:CHAD domain-containing protein n=1 Tax=Peredibacter sp. HCB2-198 TaxID=3383025 RepID=UPI0038B4DA70
MKPAEKDLHKYRLKSFIKNESMAFTPLAEKTGQQPKRKRVHDLRVSIRKMRSIVDEDFLKKLGKTLGDVRDLDVAIRNAKAYHLDNSDLKKERKYLRKKIKKSLRPSKLHKLNIKLKSIVNKVNQKPDVPARAQEMIKKLHTWEHPMKREELHPFRKTIKEVRYLLEATGQKTDYLINLQDHLGKVHDLEVFARFYKKNPTIEKEREVQIKESKKLSQQAIKRAIADLRALT